MITQKSINKIKALKKVFNLNNIIPIVAAGMIFSMVGYFIQQYSDINYLKLQVSNHIPTQIEKLDTKIDSNHKEVNSKKIK